jgi:23S rRNA (cytosine1962-C5)-methyltransferase
MVTVTSRGRARIAEGTPWLFRQDVTRGPERDAGDGGPAVVDVVDGRGRALALATWSVRSPIALRILGRVDAHEAGPARLDLVALCADRLRTAWERRRGIEAERDAYRVVHAEADALPGLIVDRYRDFAVMQTTSVAMDAHRPELAKLLQGQLGVRAVIARDDGSARDFEGLARRPPAIVAGEGGDTTLVTYRMGANVFEADLLTDGKTGGFLDQADNHVFVAGLAPAKARCLDAFAYHGGFALALARAGGPVLATDEDPVAVDRMTANARRNGLANLETRRANAFDLLRALEGQGQHFDVVVVDPPAFAKRAGGRQAADRAYKEVFLRGMRVTAPGGIVVLCSCSGQVSRDDFDRLCVAAAADAGRPVQVIARRGAGRDHPELLGVRETGHLKCWVLRVLPRPLPSGSRA